MSGFGRPTDVGIQRFGQYAFQRTQGQVTGELVGDAQGFSTGHGQQTFTQGQGLHPMMNQFMREEAGPWTSLEVEKRLSTGVSFSQDLPSFSGFRMPPPSEADTVSQSVGGVRSDSGYGSMAIQSVGNPSVYGDGDPTVDATLASRLQAMGKDNFSLAAEPRKREARGQRPGPGASSTKGIVCPTCDAPLKTNSELK